MSKSNIFLVGPMGVGKSTIGRLLAAELNLSFCDSDRAIEERTGADIPWIFDMEGEAGFRERETTVLTELAAESGLVIATGGGIIMRSQNCQIMKESGYICYLTASLDQLVERTARDKKRPLLQVENPRQKIIELLAIRDPLYNGVADFIVNTDRRSPKSVAQELSSLIQSAS